jgi:hypothetical protein
MALGNIFWTLGYFPLFGMLYHDAGLPDFSWSKHTKTEKIYQMTTNYTERL